MFRYCVSLLVVLLATLPLRAQLLGQVRQDADKKSSSNSSSNKSSDDSSNNFSNVDGEGLGGLVVLAGVILGAPFYAPYLLMNDSYDQQALFPYHPYPADFPAYLWLGRDPVREDAPIPPEPGKLNWWSVRLALEDGNDFHGLNRLGSRFTFDTTWRVGLTSNWSYFQERLPCGCVDDSLLGDTNLTFRFAQNEWLQCSGGLGFRVMTDRYQTRWGFNFTYGVDYFPAKPLILSGVFDAGTLGNTAVWHGRGTLGANFHSCEFFGGYDFFRIGSVNLQGPLLGLRFWF